MTVVASSLSHSQMLWHQLQGPQEFPPRSLTTSETLPSSPVSPVLRFLVCCLASLPQAVPGPFWKTKPFQMPTDAIRPQGYEDTKEIQPYPEVAEPRVSLREAEHATQGHTAQSAHTKQAKLPARERQTVL